MTDAVRVKELMHRMWRHKVTDTVKGLIHRIWKHKVSDTVRLKWLIHTMWKHNVSDAVRVKGLIHGTWRDRMTNLREKVPNLLRVMDQQTKGSESTQQTLRE